MKGERFIAKANFVPLTATGSSDKMSNPKKLLNFSRKAEKHIANLRVSFLSKRRRKMKQTIKKEEGEERPALEVTINGLPDLSLMPPEELNMLACGLDKIISKILETE